MKFYRNLTIRQKQIVWAYAFLALPILFYSVIRFYPTGNAILISFQDWNLLGDRTWTGLDNYVKLFSDPVFWQVFRNTFVYLLIGTPVSLVISF
ncbi:MAG: multiple sugar transport system permease protein, partial [Dinoroseobacter sp.]